MIGSKVNNSGITWPNDHLALLSRYGPYNWSKSLNSAKWIIIVETLAIKQVSLNFLPFPLLDSFVDRT
jgi:hypothetical protein